MSSNVHDQRVKKWLEVLDEPDPEMSKIAADKLGELKDKRAVKALTISMQRRTELVAAASAKALGAINDPTSIPDLIKVLKTHREVLVQTGAAEALGMMKAKQAIPALKKEVQDYLAENKSDRFSLTRGYKRGLFTTCLESLKKMGDAQARRFAIKAESALR